MSKLNWLIIGIPVLILIILTIVLIATSSQDSNYVNKNEIVDYFNNLNYDDDGAPQGGFLISMLPMSNICEKYKWTTETNECASVDTCGKILNVADINVWLTTILPGGTNCYNIATTYWRKDFPQYVFGPYKGDDMTIGVLLNVTTIFDYIAGMYPMDSGTIARYNNFCSKTLVDNPPFQDCCDCLQRPDTVCYPDIDPSEFITSDKSKRKSKWHNWLATSSSNALGMGGIGKLASSGIDTGGLFGLQSADQWLAVTPEAASTQLAKIKNLRPEALEAPNELNGSYIPNWSRYGRSFTVSNSNVPFDKYNWVLWAKAVKICYENAEKDRLDYVDSQDLGFDGYRENEVDLIVPNKSRKCSETSQGPCEVQDAFKKVFINSIMGIISVAEDNCSNSTVNAAQGPGGVGCVDGTDNCQSKPSERQSIKDSTNANPVTCLKNKNNCFDRSGTYWCTVSNKNPKVKCCCSQEFSENLVKKMVDEFNNSSLRIEAGARKIHGYKVRCESMYSFSWKGMNQPIDIEQIT